MSGLRIKIIEDPQDILKYLQIGTKLPIFPEFDDYILYDLRYFHAKSFLLEDNGNPTGHTLIYHTNDNTLFFGFFGVINDDNHRIIFLIDKLTEYAEENGFKFIIGPINIPTIIFGWGFMQEGSLDTVFIGKPINNPRYIDLFIKNNFLIDKRELSMEGKIPKLVTKKMLTYNYSNYEIFHPKNWNELYRLKKSFLKLSTANMPSNSVITPDPIGVFDNYLKFVIKYGKHFMFTFVRELKSKKIVACMAGVPNPFRKNKEGQYDSFSFFSFVVEKTHRRKGLGWLVVKEVFDHAVNNNMKYFSSPVESTQKTTQIMAKKLSVSSKRIHVILRYQT